METRWFADDADVMIRSGIMGQLAMESRSGVDPDFLSAMESLIHCLRDNQVLVLLDWVTGMADQYAAEDRTEMSLRLGPVTHVIAREHFQRLDAQVGLMLSVKQLHGKM